MENRGQIAFTLRQLGQVMVIGLFFGCLVAVVAHIFVEGVKYFSEIRIRVAPIEIAGFTLHYGQVFTLTVAAVAIYTLKRTLSIGRWHGPADSIFAAHRTDNELDVRTGLTSTLVAFLSASGGASVGQYGPLVHFGAVIGSGLKRILKSDMTTDVFIGCGVAAAISAGFNAPIAGVIFAHEAVIRHFSLRAIAPIAIASCSAAGLTELLWGGSTLFEVGAFAGELSVLLPFALIMGPFFGLVAVLLMQSVRNCTKFVGVRGISPVAALTFAVVVTTVGGAFFPEALGLGGDTVRGAINLEFTFTFLVALLIVKIALTTVCLSFGLFGGIFSPSLVVGASAGAIALGICTMLGLDPVGSVGIVICGMAAVSSAVIGSPIAGVMIVLELTGSYEYALLAMVSIVLAVLTSHHLFGHSFFDRQLSDRGIDIATGRTGLEMMDRSIAGIVHDDYAGLSTDDTAESGISKILKAGMNEAYVLAGERDFIGKVTLQQLLLAEPKTVITSLLQQNPISIKSDASLQQAMEIAVEFIGESIPIIDRDTNEMLGIITEGDLFKDYLQLQNRIVDLERR